MAIRNMAMNVEFQEEQLENLRNSFLARPAPA